MTRRAAGALVVLGLLAACEQAEVPTTAGAEDSIGVPTPLELRPVVDERIAQLEARLAAAATTPPAAPEDLEERVTGLLETAAAEREAMATLVLDELAELGDAAVEALGARLVDRGLPAAQRRAAADVLARIDTPAAATVLLDVLVGARADKTTEGWLTAQCAWRLGQTSQDWVAPRLGLCLKYEKDHETVVWIADTLARFGLLTGLSGLFSVQAAPSTPEVGAQASAVLERLRTELGCADWFELAALWRDGEVERLAPVQRSPRYRLEVWLQIRALREWQLRWVDDGRFLLSGLREDAAAMMAEALGDENVYVRLHCAQCLERMGPRGRIAGEALARLVADPRAGDQAVAALGAVGHQPALELVLAGLAPEASLNRRVSSARALAGLEVPDLAARLEPLLAEDQPFDLRVAAACSLLGQTPPRPGPGQPALEVLCTALTSPEVTPQEAEAALEGWLEAADPESDPEGVLRDAHEAWLAVPAEPARARLEARARILREGPLASAD